MNWLSGNTLLVAGSANLDFVVRASHVPAPGETVLGREFQTFPGGKGANQAVAAARAGGVPTRMLLALGQDAFAPVIEDSLRDAGVQLHVVRCAQPTGTAFICLSDDAENAITVAPGANSSLRGQDLPSLEGVSHVLLQLETPLECVLDFARTARDSNVRVVLNAAPAQALPGELLGLLDVLIVNEGELAAITGHSGSVIGALELLDVPCVVVTLGARGCCARLQGQWLLQPAFVVQPLDTTAAGDTFCGMLVAALGNGETLPLAMRAACAASALACTRLGAQSSIPQRHEVQALLQSHGPHDPEAHAVLAAYCGLV